MMKALRLPGLRALWGRGEAALGLRNRSRAAISETQASSAAHRAAPVPDIDGQALLARVEAAGTAGSAARMETTHEIYNVLRRELGPETWSRVPGLRDFIKATGDDMPFIPEPVMARKKAYERKPAEPRGFLPLWRAENGLVDPLIIDGSDFVASIQSDGERAEAFSRKNIHDSGFFFIQYAAWFHSLSVARALAPERVIDFGAPNMDFARFLTSQLPDVEVCAIDPAHPIGLQEVGPRMHRLGAPPIELGLFEDESVDLIVSHSRFERLTGDEDERAMAEIERVLVKGGRFLVTPFLTGLNHALTVSPFPCFVANGDVDYGAIIEAEIESEGARVDFNMNILTPISRRYSVASAKRRLLSGTPRLAPRARSFAFAPHGFGDTGFHDDKVFGMDLPQALFKQRAFMAMEFIKT